MAEIYTTKEYHYIEEKLGGKLCRLFAKLDCFLAGGAITSIFSNQPINDFDIFFRDSDSFEKAKRYFAILVKYDDKNTKEVCITERATTYERSSQRGEIAKITQNKYGPTYDVNWKNEKIKVQLVDPKVLCGTPEEIFMSFDFTICMGAYMFKQGEFVFDKAFLKDIARRELVFNAEGMNVISSFFRAHKYKSRGYTMTMAEEMKMALVLGSKKFATFADFVKSGGAVMGEDVIQHLYNHISYPTNKKNEDSLLDQPYNVDAVIGWLEELQHAGWYVPTTAVEGGIVFPKTSYQVDSILNKSLEGDLSEESIKEIEKVEDTPFLLLGRKGPLSCSVPVQWLSPPVAVKEDDEDFDIGAYKNKLERDMLEE